MHYFEGDPAAQREGRAAVPLPPRVVTDPAGRCAAMSLYFSQLALLPALEVWPVVWQYGGTAGVVFAGGVCGGVAVIVVGRVAAGGGCEL